MANKDINAFNFFSFGKFLSTDKLNFKKGFKFV